MAKHKKSNMDLVLEVYPDAKCEPFGKWKAIYTGNTMLGKGQNGRSAWLSAYRNISK